VPVAEFTPNYQLNVLHAFGTAPQLADFLTKLRATSGIAEVNVAAHSLGNMVMSSALTDYHAPVSHYFLLDAAVAAEAYDATETTNPMAIANMPNTAWTRDYAAAYPSKLWASNWHERFPVTGDARRSLTWQDRFANGGSTIRYDFFSTGDHVLALDTGSTPSLLGVLAGEMGHYLDNVLSVQAGQPNGYRTWAYQEKLKGRTVTGKILGSNYGGWGFNNFFFKKSPGSVAGKGPIMTASLLKPDEAQALLPTFTDEVLREEPFFRPGGFWTKVGTWKYDSTTQTNSWSNERLLQLYDPAAGSGFAERHRDTLLARMIPALSLVAGQDAVEAFTPNNSPSRNFDINLAEFRGTTQTPPWPASRNGDTRWRHSDLRAVAFPYVKKLYDKLTELGNLGQATP